MDIPNNASAGASASDALSEQADPSHVQFSADAVRASGLAVWRTDLAAGRRWWSPAMYALHGLTDGAPIPADYFSLVAPEDRARVEEAFLRSFRHGAHKVEYQVVWPDGSTHWLEGVGSTSRDENGAPSIISGVSALIDDRKRIESDLRFLALASRELARASDLKETLHKVAQLAVPHFADWCSVDMLTPAGTLQRIAVTHVDPAKARLAQQLHERYPPRPDRPIGALHILRTGLPEMVPHISEEVIKASVENTEHLEIVQSLGLKSYMGLPIKGRGGVLGVVGFVSAESRRVYGEQDFLVAQELVDRAGLAVQNTLLLAEMREVAKRQEFELALADVLRRPGTTTEILTVVCEMLARKFKVNQAGYGEVSENADQIRYEICWSDGSMPPQEGSMPASAIGGSVMGQLLAGEVVATTGALNPPHGEQEVATLAAPLLRAGQLRNIVYLHSHGVRSWNQDEMSLLKDVAERTRELIERGRTEQALRESEARWRGIFERMAEGFFIGEALRDADGHMRDFNFVQVNPAFEKLTGLRAQDAVGSSVKTIIPGLQAELIQSYAEVVDSGKSAEFEVKVPALDDRWYQARAQRVADNQFSALFLEITARKRAEAELTVAAERYRTLFESIDQGFCILEVLFDGADLPTDYRFLEVNPAFERQSGLLGAVGRTVREMLPDIEDSYISTYGHVARTGQSIRFESHARSLNRWFDAFAFRVGLPEQRKVALLFTDITERKVAVQQLREREAALQEAQDLAGIGSWGWSLATGHIDVSPALMVLLGIDRVEDFPAFEAQRGTLYPDEDWCRLAACVNAAITEGRPYSVDLQAIRRGTRIWVTARGEPVRDELGQIVGLRGTVQDMTERKQIEQALRDSDMRKDEFLATLAHELRNPLAPLRNGLSLLRVADPASSKGVRALELMERQLAHLVRLVDDLLDVSRLSQGKVILKRSRVSLQSIVELALETARPLIDAAGHEFSADLPTEPVLLEVDATRIGQVISNLLNNAAKYTPPGGRIRLLASRLDATNVRIEVQDNGVGIPPDMLDSVFELFLQLGSGVDRAQGGLGIGLSLARRLVELHGGSIRADSDGIGRCSRFVVDLPAVPAGTSKQIDAESSPGVGPGEGKRIVVVDDNHDAAETLAMLLDLDGHSVQVAYTGKGGLELVSSASPDVVFLDIGLPDLNGYEVAARLKQQGGAEHIKLVALTGWGAQRDLERSRRSGFDVHLTKPVALEDLRRAIGTL